MDSSKTTIIGMVLIFLVFIGWLFWMNEQQSKVPKPLAKPSTAETTHVATPPPAEPTVPAPQPRRNAAPDTSGIFASHAAAATSKTVETPYFTAQISSNGAAISSFILKKYNTWNGKPVELINHEAHQGGDIDLKFASADGKTVATNNLPFALDPASVSVGPNDSITFVAVYRMDSNRSIEKVFHFTGSKYVVGIEYRLHGLENSLGGYHYTASLDDPLPYVEQRTSDETSGAKAFAGQAGEMEDLNVTKVGQSSHKSVGGDISYAGTRIEYFEQALIPMGEKTVGAEISGFGATLPDNTVEGQYNASVNIPIGRTSNETLAFQFYLGPLEYDRVESLGVGLEQSMYFGWTFVVRPISIHLLLPFFLWLHGFFSNWGVVIIVFSILIKLVTVPLSLGQMRSMKKMQVVQPIVTEVRNKYKDDPKKVNEEMMKVYRTYGVNPAGGCLPVLLQMPILFALYQVLKNVIELRQAPFAFWIHDLSIPDALIHFGTKLPLIGEQMSGLTLLLVITMFVQQLFTVTDPRQKQMAYIMPVIFIFMFNNLPSGVGLYYFMFNVFGVFQQIYLTKIATPPSLEEMKAAPKKGGGIMGRIQQMEQQQREVRKQQYAGKGLPSKKKK
ncbi:MAG TPA: membrane protein insertase YidC [Candidatus Kapabacteria bacterium]